MFDAEILTPQDTTAIDLTYKRTQILNKEYIYTGNELLNTFIREHIFTPSPCLSFINTAFLRQQNLSFYPGIIHEDQLFTCKLYLNANKVMCIAKPFFKRRFRSDSTMTNRFAWKNMHGYLTVTEELLLYADQHPQHKKLISLFLSQMLNAAVWQAHVLPLKEKIKLLPRIAQHRQYIRLRTWLVLMQKK